MEILHVPFIGGSQNSPSPQVNLQFACAPSGETFLVRRFVTYPFFLAAPFRLDRTPAGMLTTILQSVSGGIYERERLALSVTAGRNAQVHCTTQSATVVHSMPNEGEASQLVTLHAADGSFVEYLPDPLILFPEAKLRTALHVVVEEGAVAIFSEAFFSHDPETRSRPFHSLCSETLVHHTDGRLLCADRFNITGGEVVLASSGYNAQGTVWIVTSRQHEKLLVMLRKTLANVSGLYAGVSALPNNAGVVSRFLATDTVALSTGLHAAWVGARYVLAGEEPQSRRKAAWF
jgi:urease accessory protein